MSTRIVPDMSSSPALARYRAGPAPFALVTGATAGMGEAWAHALAAHGFNLLLHGRSPAKLAAVRDAVLASFPTRDVRLCVLDACALPPDARELEGGVAPLNLRIVVNNVGGSGGHFESVLEMPSQQLVDEITCNAVFPTLVAKVTLPKLRTGGPGLMLNISSIGGIWPSPYISVYSASKAFNRLFSMSLHGEELAEGTDVDVVCLAPGAVVNGRAMQGDGSAMTPLSSTWVVNAIAAISPRPWRQRPKPFIVPHPAHRYSVAFLRLLPNTLANSIFRSQMVALRDESRGVGKASRMSGGGNKSRTPTALGPKATPAEQQQASAAAPAPALQNGPPAGATGTQDTAAAPVQPRAATNEVMAG